MATVLRGGLASLQMIGGGALVLLGTALSLGMIGRSAPKSVLPSGA